MMPKYTSITLLFFCLSSHVLAQQQDSVLKEITSHLAESLPEQEDLSELTDQLAYYKRHPVDLSHLKPGQLKELLFLSALQISNLVHHLQVNGPMKDLLELQAVDEFDVETINRLLPYVTLKQESEYRRISFGTLVHKGENEIVWRYVQTLEKQKGFNNLPGSRYLGGPQKLLLKYKYNLGSLTTFSFVADRDAGETFFSGSNKSGFDFISASLALYKTGRFKKIIIGDFSLQFGQGLTLWTGSSFGKGPDVAGVAKKDTGLKTYTSTNELSFFRGIASTFKIIKNIDLTTFISSRRLDASLSKDQEGKQTLSTIGSSGLHRTATEIRNKGDLGQFLYGAAAELSNTGFNVGLVAYHSSYQHEFVTGKQLYKRYSFYGQELSNLGIYYNYTLRNIYFFGEASKSEPGGLALLTGAMASLSPIISAVVAHRAYKRDYMNFYSQPLGEGSGGANEKGIYGGIHLNRGNRWTSSIYVDFFHFPWAKYRIDTASSGYELMWLLSFIPRKTFKASIKMILKEGEQNESSGLPVNPIVQFRKNNYRVAVNWKLSRKIGMENRLEITQYHKGNASGTYGYMAYQDMDYSPMSSKLAANIRVAFFNTPVYENRIYAYEDDVLNGAGSGLYNGRGIRTFLNLNYRLSKQLRVWMRYAISIYPGEDTIGSGLDEIDGNRKSEIKLQVRYQF